MKRIVNNSFQTWCLPLQTPEGIKYHWLKPDETIKVPASYITTKIKNLKIRRLVAITN